MHQLSKEQCEHIKCAVREYLEQTQWGELKHIYDVIPHSDGTTEIRLPTNPRITLMEEQKSELFQLIKSRLGDANANAEAAGVVETMFPPSRGSRGIILLTNQQESLSK